MTIRRLRPKTVPTRLSMFRLESRLAPANFLVTTLLDNVPGSLRAAITSANATAAADDIVFSVSGTITLTAGELPITQPLTINGGGIAVSGNNTSRVFNTTGAAAGTKIAFNGLFIVNGKGVIGGGITADDQALTLAGCTVSGNKSTIYGGGIAVANAPGSLTLLGSIFTNNHSDFHGGAIYLGVDVATTITGCPFAGNTADYAAGAIFLSRGVAATVASCTIVGNTAKEQGGAIASIDGSLTISNSTLSGNSALGSTALSAGGGLFFRGTVGAGGLTVRNCTLSGNTAGSSGGAIAMDYFTGKLTIQNSTITNNTASGQGGGGIARIFGTGTISLESTIVSGNNDTVSTHEDVFTTGTVSAKFSAIGTKSGVSLFSSDAVTTSLLGANLKLGPLANNGGSGGQTHVPAPDSPLINNGSNPAALTTDQRGSVTVRNSNGGVDIGSVELQVFLVSNTDDKGTGSLRTAISNANTFGGSDTVAFDPAIFITAKTITLTTGEIAINQDVTILGPAAKLTIDGNANGRIFRLDAVTGAPIVLQALTLTNGFSKNFGGAIATGDEALTLLNCSITNSTSGAAGGAIQIGSPAGSLLIEDSVLAGNKANDQASSSGGAVYSLGSVIIRRSTITENVAEYRGGAIYAYPSLVIEDSTISGNIAGGSGGAIDLVTGGILTIEDCVLSDNIANSNFLSRGGGAVMFDGPATTFLIRNSTFSGNAAPFSRGGAVHLGKFSGTAIFENCTITANSAGEDGGGIARNGPTGAISLNSSIVSGNTNANSPDVFFTVSTNVDGNNNLIGVADGGNFNLTGTGNLTGTKASPLNAQLESLGNNGGPTMTHALKSGSPAINQGNNSANLTNDQRGVGFARVVGGLADIGAFELQAAPPKLHDGIINGGQTQRSRVTAVKFIFNTVVTLPAMPETAFQLKRDSDNAIIDLSALVTNGAKTDVSLTFVDPLVESGSLPDGRYTLTIFASKVSADGFQLDGNGDGIPGDDHVVLSVGTGGIFRLFGDNDGDAAVTSADFAEFRKTFGTSINLAYDFDNDGNITSNDFAEFRKRFGISLLP